MEVKFDNEKIQEAIQDSANKAISEALSGYGVQRAIGEIISEHVATGIIGEAILNAVKDIDLKQITQNIASELQQAIVVSTISVMREGAVDMVCNIRGIDKYAKDYSEFREKTYNKMFRRKKDEN